MQELFSPNLYAAFMSRKHTGTPRLRELREAAGLSIRELARRIDEDHSNVRYWENSGKPPRSDVLIPMAEALGVTVEELLGEPRPRRAVLPGGKLGETFAAVSKLPRRQQQKVVEMAQGFVALHSAGKGS